MEHKFCFSFQAATNMKTLKQPCAPESYSEMSPECNIKHSK